MHKFSKNALSKNPNLLIGNMFYLYLFYCLKHVIEQNHNEELILPKKSIETLDFSKDLSITESLSSLSTIINKSSLSIVIKSFIN